MPARACAARGAEKLEVDLRFSASLDRTTDKLSSRQDSFEVRKVTSSGPVVQPEARGGMLALEVCQVAKQSFLLGFVS